MREIFKVRITEGKESTPACSFLTGPSISENKQSKERKTDHPRNGLKPSPRGTSEREGQNQQGGGEEMGQKKWLILRAY